MVLRFHVPWYLVLGFAVPFTAVPSAAPALMFVLRCWFFTLLRCAFVVPFIRSCAPLLDLTVLRCGAPRFNDTVAAYPLLRFKRP
jgi:hypothetical protein